MNGLQHLIVTGGTGYIGARLTRHASQIGVQVTVLARSDKGLPPGTRFVGWSLGEPLPAGALSGDAGSTALIHLAHDWENLPSQVTTHDNLNLTGTKTLLDSCRENGIARFVFVSSQSARPDAPNIYGRIKWQTEQLLDGADAVSARVGLVYGGSRKAMFGLLFRLVKLPVIPMVSPSQLVQPIHLDELCRGLLLLARSDLTGWKGLAGPLPATFGEFLRELARIGHGRHLSILPIPLSLALLGCELTRYIPVIPTVDKERVLGLAGTRPIPTRDDLTEMGLDVLPFTLGLGQGPLGRKGLLVEGHTLLRYVLGRPASRALLLRYVRAVQLQPGDKLALGLPALVIAAPAFLRFIEPFHADHPLAKRLALATALAGASPDGSRSFLTAGESGRAFCLLRMGAQLVADVCAMPIRLLLSRRRDD